MRADDIGRVETTEVATAHKTALDHAPADELHAEQMAAANYMA